MDHGQVGNEFLVGQVGIVAEKLMGSELALKFNLHSSLISPSIPPCKQLCWKKGRQHSKGHPAGPSSQQFVFEEDKLLCQIASCLQQIRLSQIPGFQSIC
jgi:hypothetical protein